MSDTMAMDIILHLMGFWPMGPLADDEDEVDVGQWISVLSQSWHLVGSSSEDGNHKLPLTSYNHLVVYGVSPFFWVVQLYTSGNYNFHQVTK